MFPVVMERRQVGKSECLWTPMEESKTVFINLALRLSVLYSDGRRARGFVRAHPGFDGGLPGNLGIKSPTGVQGQSPGMVWGTSPQKLVIFCKLYCSTVM